MSLVQTVDFITPVVNDPYMYGQIAAANSLSDVFAMGGVVHTCLNIVCFDSCNLTPEMLKDILAGGASKVREASGYIVGGHTVEDIEMKYGLSVTGLVKTGKHIRNNNIQTGDVLILTKPIGTGVITTAIKGDMASESIAKNGAFFMSYLNKTASELAVECGANAMTDVTGFGLLGHMYEMTRAGVSVRLNSSLVPLIDGAEEMASFGLFPGGSYKNKQHFESNIIIEKEPDGDRLMLMYDAQTSGGLLISAPKEKSQGLLDKLKLAGMEWVAVIGEVTDENSRKIILG